MLFRALSREKLRRPVAWTVKMNYFTIGKPSSSTPAIRDPRSRSSNVWRSMISGASLQSDSSLLFLRPLKRRPSPPRALPTRTRPPGSLGRAWPAPPGRPSARWRAEPSGSSTSVSSTLDGGSPGGEPRQVRWSSQKWGNPHLH